jgi:hypothetical protein
MLVIRKQAAAEEPSATGGAKVDSAKRVAFGKHATGGWKPLQTCPISTEPIASGWLLNTVTLASGGVDGVPDLQGGPS